MKAIRLQLSSGIIRIGLFLLLMVTLAGCIGREGPMGPAGLDGINYTRSVIYDVNASDWAGNVDGYNAVLTVPEITDDIYYNGAVLVYRLVEIDPKSFNLLPYTYVDNDLTIYVDFDAFVGSIDLIYKEVLAGVNDTPAPTNLMSFKVVIIEGIPLGELKKKVNVNDYSAVARLFNLDDVHKIN